MGTGLPQKLQIQAWRTIFTDGQRHEYTRQRCGRHSNSSRWHGRHISGTSYIEECLDSRHEISTVSPWWGSSTCTGGRKQQDSRSLDGKVSHGLHSITSHSCGRLLSFNDVDVLDIASYSPTKRNGTWVTQSKSADFPPARIDTCVALASASNDSSHNIYMYGGWNPTSNPIK